jgi:putative phosphoribosyl transferase
MTTKTAGLVERMVRLPPVGLEGDLIIPDRARGVILFAHGSGSSRHSSRNRYVAGVLQRGGLATLLIDLLTSEEEQVDIKTGRLRFDIPLLATRMLQATDWLRSDPATRELNIGYFGASTGAAAALVAAAERRSIVCAVVSRGGRPDLAGESLPLVAAPTLLIVGGRDEMVIELNRSAQARLQAENRLTIVPGATHLFEEPGTLEQVADLALSWFQGHLERTLNAE